MKKFLSVFIIGLLLISGCKNSKPDNNSSNTVSEPTENSEQTTEHSSAEPDTVSSENTSSNEPENSSLSTVQSSPVSSRESSTVSVNSISSASKSSVSSSSVITSKPESRIESTIESIASSSAASSSSSKKPEISSAVLSSAKIPEPPSIKEEEDLNITITVSGKTFSASLNDNETAKAFKARLPLTLDMSELNGNEKYYYLPEDLPTNSSRQSKINTGEIMLYGSSCIVIFYESFSTSYSYTPIGKIDDPAGLAAALGRGNVQVTFNAAG